MKPLNTTLTESLGFSPKKARVYLALLELGESEAAAIAKKSGLKRTTVYNILPELISENLISHTLKKGKKVFFIDSPSRLSQVINEKKESIDLIIPELSSLQNLFFIKPQITLHEGIEGFKEIYRDFLDSVSAGDTVLAYAGTRDHFAYVPQGFVEEYLTKRIAKKIRLKLIAGKSPLSEQLQKTDLTSLRETKITTSKDFDFCGEMIIYGNKVAFISYKENFLGAIIQSKEISAMHRAAFNLSWESVGSLGK